MVEVVVDAVDVVEVVGEVGEVGEVVVVEVVVVEVVRVTVGRALDGVATSGSVAADVAEVGTSDVPAVFEHAEMTVRTTTKITDERWSLMTPL